MSFPNRFAMYLSAAACAAAMLLGPAGANAQVLYGSIVGNVTDPSNAAVAGAVVTVTNTQTNQSRQAATNDSGLYQFPTIPSGTYTIKIEKPGFRAYTQSNVQVTINTASRVDVTMQLGAVSETVQVTGESVGLQTDRTEVRQEVNTEELENLPVPTGRNYQQLFRAVPGFTPPRDSHSVPSNPSRSLEYNVNGVSADSNDVRIDGASQYNIWLPHVTAYVPALEAIDTVNVVTNSFDAEQGLAGGSAVNVQIKSGTNAFHGSAFEYHYDNALKARPYFLPAGQSKPKDIFNQFGGTFGGPIKHDKLFFFGSYEGTPVRQFASTFATVPTAAMKRGDMSDAGRPIYDPNTGNPDGSGRQPFAGNQIPANRIDAITKKIAALIPDPTFPNLLANNYYAGAPFSFTRHTMDSKVNWNATSKFTSFVRFSMLRYDMTDPQVFGDALGGPPISGFGGNPGHGFGGTYTGTVAGTYVLSPTFIVDANFGYTLMDTNSAQPRLNEKVGSDLLGIPGTNGSRTLEGGWPTIRVNGFTTYGLNDTYMPYFRSDPQYNYVANASWIKGTHNVRWGMDISHQNLNHTQPEFYGTNFGAPGGFTFTGGVTSLRGGPSPNQFNEFSDFLLGLPNVLGKNYQVPDVFHTRTWEYSLYIRDQWQATPRLTLTYGTRWEYFPMPTRADRGLERYDFANNMMLVCGVGAVPSDCGVSVSARKFAPRVGIAWRATDTFVIRAGYGLTNDPFNLARPLRTNYPVLVPFEQRAANSFVAVSPIDAGIPPITVPSLDNGVIPIEGRVALNTPPPNEFRRGYIQSWNFTLQKQLGKGFVGQAGYVATRSINELGYLDYNAGRPGGGLASEPLYQQFGRQARTAVVQPIGNSHYDSLQTTLDRRFANGIQLNVAYTFSKATGIAGVSESAQNAPIQIPEFYNLNRALLDFDRTHNFTVTTVAELPFGKGRHWLNHGGFAQAVAGGWQINALLSRYSGTPFSVSSSGTSLDAPGNSQRADQVKQNVAILGGHGPGQPYFDPFAFAPVTQPRFGTAGFNTLRGPGLTNLDFGLFRDFAMTERWRLQFRAEAFNFTNTPHFANPGANVSNLNLNQDGTIRRLGGYTEINSTSGVGRDGVDERVFRLGLRVSF